MPVPGSNVVGSQPVGTKTMEVRKGKRHYTSPPHTYTHTRLTKFWCCISGTGAVLGVLMFVIIGYMYARRYVCMY